MTLQDIRLYNQKRQEAYAAKTGFTVDIQNIGRNTATIARKVNRSLTEVNKGVWVSTDSIEFSDGNFTNVHNLFWDSKDARLSPVIHSARAPYYLFDYIKNDSSIHAVINGSFFFLIDVSDKEPKDYPFHFCIREGKVIGLLEYSFLCLFK